MTLRVRWLGRVSFGEALDLQRALCASPHDYLLLLEHPPTYTLGVRADETHLLVDPTAVGAELHRVDRGGDVTFHGPGQLVGYPILTLADHAAGQMASTRRYVRAIEGALVAAVGRLGVEAGRMDGCPGVWIDPSSERPRKLAAIGVRLTRGRSMHGFALNVETDPEWFARIVPCGIADKGVTSLAAEGVQTDLRTVVDLVVDEFAARFGAAGIDRADVVWRSPVDGTDLSRFSRGDGAGDPVRYRTESRQGDGTSLRLLGRLVEAGVDAGLAVEDRKPNWLRAKVSLGADVLALKKTLRRHDLVTVCEEAGCPNLSECWSEGTATFMLCGERCTRACGFCLVDTRHPEALDSSEPTRVAAAVAELELDFVVLTMVARDDLVDGGAAHVAAAIDAIRVARPSARVEALISDLRGDASSLATVLRARPDVVNHNIETVARLQRVARPSASYARSLALLARAKAAGATTKSGLVAGMGETFDEVVQTLADLSAVGVDIVTIGQYLRPTTHHLPVERWWTPADFAAWKRIGEAELGLAHVESSPFTRSSHHAGAAFETSRSGPNHLGATPVIRPNSGVVE